MIVLLTEEQTAQVAPVIEKAELASAAGQPGMCFAQVYDDHIVVGYLEHDKAVKFLEAIGADTKKRTRSAFDRTVPESLAPPPSVPSGSGSHE